MYRGDTIVAPATAAGRAAVAIVRLSGPESLGILQQIFFPTHAGELKPWTLRHGRIVVPGGEPIDEVLATFMPAPRSYSGEDVVEVHCHGSPLVVERVVELCVLCGARPADPGEFTRRAVLNGKLDLVQAEAVADLIDSRVSSGAADAWDQLQGALSAQLEKIRRGLLGVLADIEANADFSDEELPIENQPARIDGISLAIAEVDVLLGGFAAARRRREGWRVVFSGRPNAGKSSLVNALLGSGRMIVSDEPGTTRDVVEETVDLAGTAFVLIDTAGLRETDSVAEQAAVGRARASFSTADLVLAVVDSSVEGDDELLELLEELPPAKTLLVLSKTDLPRRLSNSRLARLQDCCTSSIEVSTMKEASGVEPLVACLRALAAEDQSMPASAPARVRHRTALERARTALIEARRLLGPSGEAELAAIELRQAAEELASITHPLDNEEVLDIIFRDFCIGK